MKKEIYKGIIISISFTLTTLFSIIGYASWVNLSTQNTGDVINAEIWNNLIGNVNDLNTRVSGISIPTGFIGSFYLTSCPTGWVLADGTNGTPDLRGKFIRANVTSATYDPDYASRTSGLGDINKVGSSQLDSLQDFDIGMNNNGTIYKLYGYFGSSLNNLSLRGYAFANAHNSTSTNRTRTDRQNYRAIETSNGMAIRLSSETRSKNTALLFCMKQ